MTEQTNENNNETFKELFLKTPQDRITATSVSLALLLAMGYTALTPTLAIGLTAAFLISMRKTAKEHSVPMFF